MTKFINFFKKPLESVSDEISTKFKTPFISTYIFVWLVRNNLFVYDLLFNNTITNKTNTLKKQFNIYESDFYLQTFCTILITLSLMIVLYILLNISRIITIISEERLKLNILNYFQSKTIRSKEDVDFWRKKAEKLNEKNQELASELSLVRNNLDYSKNQFKKAEEEVENIISSSKNFVRSINSTLNSKLYNIKTPYEKGELINFEELKEEIDKEFKTFDNTLKLKKPGFLLG